MKTIITGPTWNPKIPEVYQIEAVAVCNLKCPFCPTGIGTAEVSQDKIISLDLFKTIVDRDLKGSAFVELQQRGEPSLHKHLPDMVDILRDKVFVGMSTHGGLLHKPHVLEAVLKMHYLTISIEGGEKEYYEKHRVGGSFNKLIENINLVMEERGGAMYPIIDLQLIEFSGVDRQLELVQNLISNYGWRCTVRTIQDTFRGQYDPNVEVMCDELCTNPWYSVSIHADGDVVPCCMAFGKDIVYGNLKEASLETIWRESPVVKDFRKMHLTGDLPHMCATCYARSPWYMHHQLMINALKTAADYQS